MLRPYVGRARRGDYRTAPAAFPTAEGEGSPTVMQSGPWLPKNA